MSQLLADLLEEFHAKMAHLSGLTLRDVQLSTVPNKVKVAIGMRRTGKTYLLLQKIQELLTKHPQLLTRILYLNFEDDRLLPLSAPKLGELLDQFYTLYPQNHHQHCYFMLDEIQNIPQWETVVRRFFDTKQVEIYLTGSSAKLLSKEIASSLRGRAIATEIWPYSFKEYLLATKNPLPKKTSGKSVRDHLYKNFRKYLEQGGFPETVNLDIMAHNRILQDYVDVVIFRDIIERYNISNIQLIKYMIKTLLKQIGSPFSVNKFYNDLKSQGFSVSKTTLHEYLSYLEDAYLLFAVPLYAESICKIHTNPRKIYAIDTGLIRAYVTSSSENLGHFFENLVYIELRRRGFEVYYYLTKDRYEVDFLAKSFDNRLHLYQVVWDSSHPETLQRETRALQQAEKELNIKGQLVTPEKFLTWW
jgi:hypothetical protein